jgi:hypothetical protein
LSIIPFNSPPPRSSLQTPSCRGFSTLPASHPFVQPQSTHRLSFVRLPTLTEEPVDDSESRRHTQVLRQSRTRLRCYALLPRASHSFINKRLNLSC